MNWLAIYRIGQADYEFGLAYANPYPDPSNILHVAYASGYYAYQKEQS